MTNKLTNVTHTEVRRGNIGDANGWCFSVYFSDRQYPNFVSALYTRKKEAENKLDEYIKTGKFDFYGSAEKSSGMKEYD